MGEPGRRRRSALNPRTAASRHLLIGLPWLLVTLLLTAPLGAPVPVPGLDPSWRLGMNTYEDLQFGRDIVFTYGPWGFLDHPLITNRGTFAVALVARVCVIAALWLVSVRSLTRAWPLWVAAPLATVFVVLVAPGELSALAVAITAQYVLFHALEPDRPVQRRTDLMRALILGAVAGLVIQMKFSNGVAVCVLAALAVLTTTGRGGLRRHVTDAAAAGGAFLVVLCTAWLARGQSLSHLWTWARGSLELTTGYPEAMAFEFADPVVLPYVVAVLLGILAIVAVLPRLRELPLRRRVGVLLVLAAAGGFAFKSAFTRHDPFHEVVYFVILTSLFLGIIGTSRLGSRLAAAGALLATAAALSAVFTDAAVNTPVASPDPAGAAVRWRDDFRVLTSSEHQADRLDDARTAMTASHQVPASLLDALQDKPVSIEPYEASVAWAYGLNWQPVPVFQLYSAYTPALDRLNAGALRRAPAQQRVLRHEFPYTDGRNALWDSPMYHLALACNYRAEAAEASWTLLAKGRSRCGAPESLGESHVSAGRTVEVPSPSGRDIQVARFTPDPPGAFVRLGRALVKPYTLMYVTADEKSYKLSRKTSPAGVLVTFPAVEAGAHAPFDIRSLSFSEPGTLEFVRIPIKR